MRRTLDTILTKQTQLRVSFTLLLCAALGATAIHADDYQDARAELVAAYRAQDYEAMQLAAQKAVIARPGYPGALFNLALAYTLNGKHADSLRILQQLQQKGVDFGVAEIDEFAALRELPGWDAYQDTVRALNKPFGMADVVASLSEPHFVPEGIAVDGDGRLLLGSIRSGKLLRLGATPKVLLERGPSWSVFGMRFHADGSLWFASAAVPQLENVGDDEGQTGLFRVDPESGEISRAAILPQHAPAQVLGDLVIADDNTIYATDSLTGAIYRYHIDANEFETLLAPGKLVSPQGLVVDNSGKHLYVADYRTGLYRLSLADGYLVKVEMPASDTDAGIDGLYRYGDELIAIQNGIRPHRVVAFRLDDNGVGVTAIRKLASSLPEFDEPTLGVIDGDDFYFVANSHWNRFDEQQQLPADLSGPIVLKLALD